VVRFRRWKALGDLEEDLSLAVGERVEQGWGRGVRFVAGGEVLDEASRDGEGEKGFASGDGPEDPVSQQRDTTSGDGRALERGSRPARASRLSGPARQVHQAVLATFAATGLPPSPADIKRLIHAAEGDPDLVRAELTEADMLAFTAHGEIRAAYPFSPAPTPIRVRWDGGPDVYAMCAIDALGMSAMLSCPVTIAASEPDTGRAIIVAVDADQARWTPRSTVVFAGATGDPDRPSVDSCCSYISFFTTARAARAWARRHPQVTGTVLRRDGALRIGIDTFGALLHPADGGPGGFR
jgi:hypothetical protein